VREAIQGAVSSDSDVHVFVSAGHRKLQSEYPRSAIVTRQQHVIAAKHRVAARGTLDKWALWMLGWCAHGNCVSGLRFAMSGEGSACISSPQSRRAARADAPLRG
jgi:hypothetical protein